MRASRVGATRIALGLAALAMLGTARAQAPAPPEPPRPLAPAAPAWLGVFLGDAIDGGVEIVAIVANGPAEQAGLRSGDVLLKLNGRPVTDRAGVGAIVGRLRAGDRLDVDFLRAGRAERREVDLAARPPAGWVAERAPPRRGPRSASSPPVVIAIPEELRRHYGASSDRGVLVARAGRGETGEGLAVGDVLVSVGDRVIRDPGDFDWEALAARGAVLEIVRGGQARRVSIGAAPEATGSPGAAREVAAPARIAALEAEIERLRERLRELRGGDRAVEARPVRRALPAIALSIAVASAASAAGEVLRADLPDEVRESLRSGAKEDPADPAGDPVAFLNRVVEISPYRFDAGLVVALTDRRWFQTLPASGPGHPFLELRRWPGDSVVAFYAIAGPIPEDGPPTPALRGATLSARTERGENLWQWEGTLDTPMGSRSILWIERGVPDTPRRLGALLVPGDAGLGPSATADLGLELLLVAARAEVRAEAWRVEEPTAPGSRLEPPVLDAPPRGFHEKRDPWQVAEGPGFTLGLPPGLRLRRLDQGVGAPREVPGAALWLRGRFVDRKDKPVAVGDGERSGYVSLVRPGSKEWAQGSLPPAGAPRASLIAGEDFEAAREQSGAVSARAERWRESGFEGEWLVFRLRFKGFGAEIGLPVLEGRQSEALFWIPASWRGPGEAPAPPPLDPADHFGIAFEQLTRLAQKSNPWIEGYLTVPGMRLEMPRGWWPAATLRSEDGFPVTLIDGKGKTVGRVVRLLQPLREVHGSGAWTQERKTAPHRAAALYARADGARVFVSEAGDGYLLEPTGVGEPALWERLTGSVMMLRPDKSHQKSGGARDRERR